MSYERTIEAMTVHSTDDSAPAAPPAAPQDALPDPGAPIETAVRPEVPAAPVSRKEAKRRRRRRRRLHNRPLVPVELTLTDFAAGGKAVARMPDGRVAFVRLGIPGERVVAELEEEHPTYVEATAVRVLEPSVQRVEPRCPYFGPCGGCQLQHIEYGEQLRLKGGVVEEQLRRIGRFEQPPVREMIGMTNPWGYRNHMRFTVRRDGSVGFIEHGSRRFLRIDHCEIAHPAANKVLAQVQGRTMQTRQIAMRIGEHTGDVLVQPRLRWRPHKRGRTRSGQQSYRETLLGIRYRISSPAFFQVNTRQAEQLLQHVASRVKAVRPHLVVDAYAGVGTFAALLAQTVPEVATIEYSAAADDDAAANLRDLPNVRRLTGTVQEHLPALRPDVVVVDPPRVGLEGDVIDALLASTARRIVYVSCEPSTLARDLRLLVDGGFALTEVQPIDMFPHTQHIECITTLDRTELDRAGT